MLSSKNAHNTIKKVLGKRVTTTKTFTGEIKKNTFTPYKKTNSTFYYGSDTSPLSGEFPALDFVTSFKPSSNQTIIIKNFANNTRIRMYLGFSPVFPAAVVAKVYPPYGADYQDMKGSLPIKTLTIHLSDDEVACIQRFESEVCMSFASNADYEPGMNFVSSLKDDGLGIYYMTVKNRGRPIQCFSVTEPGFSLKAWGQPDSYNVNDISTQLTVCCGIGADCVYVNREKKEFGVCYTLNSVWVGNSMSERSVGEVGVTDLFCDEQAVEAASC